MRYLFLLAILAIVHFSLYPWQFHPAGFSRPFLWLPLSSNSDLTDIALNLFFYLIPAAIGQWAFSPPHPRFRTLVLTVTGLTLLSLLLEFLQLAVPTRFANLRDVFCNFLGALAGSSFALVLSWPSPLRHRAFAPAPLLATFLIAFATWHAFPFYPHLRLYRLLQIPDLLLHSPWTFVAMADIFLTLTVLYLLSLHLQFPALPLTLAAALVLPAQAVLRFVALSPASLLAAALALLFAVTCLRRPSQRHFLALSALLTAWLLFRQLSPAHFQLHSVNSFVWLPFGTLIDLHPRDASVRILAGKFLLYASTLWTYIRAGLTPFSATLALLFLLFITESLQVFLPGRTPETTDLALTLLAALLLALTQKSTPPVCPFPAPTRFPIASRR